MTEAGAQSFRCRGEDRTSAAGMVMAFNPDDPHDGHASDLGGFTYPITFTRDQKATQVNCWYTVVIGKNAFTSPDDGQIHCKS